MKYENILETIGSTPLVRLHNIEQKFNLKSKIYAKVEFFNPSGSVKDRAALSMIKAAIKMEELKTGMTIIEASSGNIGIGLAMVGAYLKFDTIIVMPDSMSIERRKIISSYGAKVILTKGSLGMKGSIDLVNELVAKEPSKYFIPSQFDNVNNPLAHFINTGEEIYKDLKETDIVVSGIGSGGTISGIAACLKKKNAKIKIIGVEPLSSPLLTKGIVGKHNIEGIGPNFIPSNLDMKLVDEIIDVSDDDAYLYSDYLHTLEAIFAGVSSGAALAAGVQIAKREENKNIVIILPDSFDRYLSEVKE